MVYLESIKRLETQIKLYGYEILRDRKKPNMQSVPFRMLAQICFCQSRMLILQ